MNEPPLLIVVFVAKVDQLAEFAEKCNIYLVAGTLRPETMYGQTNCYVKPDGDYSLCKMNEVRYSMCVELTNAYEKLKCCFKVQ